MAPTPNFRSASDCWWVYIVLTRARTYYTGAAIDPDARFAKHVAGTGAKYLRGRRPLRIVYREKCASKSAALRREAEIKRMTRKQKEQLIMTQATTPQFFGSIKEEGVFHYGPCSTREAAAQEARRGEAHSGTVWTAELIPMPTYKIDGGCLLEAAAEDIYERWGERAAEEFAHLTNEKAQGEDAHRDLTARLTQVLTDWLKERGVAIEVLSNVREQPPASA